MLSEKDGTIGRGTLNEQEVLQILHKRKQKIIKFYADSLENIGELYAGIS